MTYPRGPSKWGESMMWTRPVSSPKETTPPVHQETCIRHMVTTVATTTTTRIAKTSWPRSPSGGNALVPLKLLPVKPT